MEEILKTALHCDDKEKLKEKLALLQREYNRTVQRLQRAERTEAVQNHVRSRIGEQNLHQKGEDSVRLREPSEAKERRPCPVNQDPEENSSPAVRFSLPHDVFGPCASPRVTRGSSGSSWLSGTPQACSPSQQNSSPVPAQGLRHSSAHRLRSRRSRLRWERRERTDSGLSDTETSEDGRDPAGDGERRRDGSTPLHFSAGTSPSEAVPKPAVGCSGVADAEVVPENLPSSAHWEGHGSNSRVVCDLSPQLHSEAPLLDSRTAPVLKPPEKIESSLAAATPSPLNTAGTHSGLVAEASVPEPESPTEENRRSDASPPAPVPGPLGAERLSSCTLIEGLLFPAEYYVRTTRRMSAAQSSVDLGAVIQGQLSRGRRGRGRRGRGSSQGAVAASGSQTVAWKDTGGVGHATPESESSLTSRSSPVASGAEPPSANPVRGARRRGRRRACGQGRRRGQAHSMKSPAAIGPTMLEHLGTDPVLTSDICTNSSTAEKELYPIFCAKSQLRESSSPNMSCFPFSKESSQSNGKERLRASNCSPKQAVNCQSLLLTCSPAPQRPRVLTLGETHLSLRFLLSHFDAKDFHLPDDEFGTLKQDKLRLPAYGDLEAFAPLRSPYRTRQCVSGTPSGNTRYRKKLCEVRSLPPAGGPQCAQPEVEPAGHTPQTSGQTDLGSERDSPESLTPSLAPGEVTHQGEEQHCDAVCLGRENEAEWARKAPPLVGERTGSVGAASVGLGGGLGKGEEDSSPQRGAVMTVGVLSPRSVDLSPTPTVQTQKSEAFALPSLGVTPAFPLHPSYPVQDCCTPTPPPALPSTTHCSPRQGPVICCESNGDTQPPSLSSTLGTDVLDPSQNPPGAAVKEADPRLAEAPAEEDRSAALAQLSATKPSLTDSLFSALCSSGSVSAQCPSPALSSPVECRSKHNSPLPQRVECADARSPKTALADSQPLLSTGGRVKRDGVCMPASGKVTPTVSPKHKEGDSPQGPWAAPPALPLTGSGRPHRTDTEKGTATPCTGEDDFDRGVDPHKPEQDSLKAPSQGSTERSGSPAMPGPAALPSSLKSEYGDKDLDSYFTDSAWSRGSRPSPESGHSSPGQDPTEGRLDTPPPSTHTVREGPSSSSLKLTHVLKAPAGRCLVDVCSVSGAEGWCVVTAEDWTVCVWGQSSSPHWSLLHTWTFTEHPVIALLSVPDAPGLLCVTLGKLEIREARALSRVCAEGQLSQSVLCAGEVQAVLGVSGARVACCSTSVSTQTTNVLTLTGEGRLENSLSLVSPGQSVQALAAVDGEKDALIGSTGSSHLVLWNTRTGHLLRRFSPGEGLSGSVCLRGYSQSGVLFVLLQHQFLHDLNEEDGAPFSLIATNPVTARSVLIQHLTQPAQCAGRFADGDVRESMVAAVFQSGGLAVWDLRDGSGVTRLARGPEEGCHVARWGGPSTLLTGHLNGDVSLYQYTPLGVS